MTGIELAAELRNLIIGAVGVIVTVHVGITLFALFRMGARTAARA